MRGIVPTGLAVRIWPLRPLALAAGVLCTLGGCAGTGSPQADKAATLDETPTLRLARAARAAGDYASAVNLYRTLLPSSADPLMRIELGDTLLDAGSIDDAIQTYKGVPAGSPAQLGAALGLERAYLALNDVPEAVRQADRAHALAPDDKRVLIDRGVALDLAGRHAEAQDSYRAALAKAPGERPARVDLALSLALTKKYDQAAEIVKPIAVSTTATPRERQILALIYGLMGNEREARQWSLRDLDVGTTAENMRFYDYVRDGGR